MDEKHEDDLTSDDYIRVARLIAERLTSILRLAREQSMTPPFELRVTGTDDDVVMRASITNDGHFEDVSGFPEQPLTARFPLTATVCDAVGQTLELTIDPAPEKVQWLKTPNSLPGFTEIPERGVTIDAYKSDLMRGVTLFKKSAPCRRENADTTLTSLPQTLQRYLELADKGAPLQAGNADESYLIVTR